MKRNKTVFLVGTTFLICLISSMGCVSKGFVQGEIALVDEKVEGVEGSVEENQKRLKKHDERLSTLGSLITQHESQLQQFDTKIEEVKRYSRGRLIYTEMLRNDEAKFKTDSYELSDEAKLKLDNFVNMLIAENRGVYLEIQGHTDNMGSESWNLLLGKKRAEAAMMYLYDKYHIPLHRMEVISYGSSKPLVENTTRQGRAQNRRVEILVYE
jgi:outer membrane protein OmpA-like peptidoglycan-associated protein